MSVAQHYLDVMANDAKVQFLLRADVMLRVV